MHSKIISGCFALLLMFAGTHALAKKPETKANNGNSQKPAGEWYVKTRLTVTTPGGRSWVDNYSGVFGKLDASEGGYDKHDIPAYGSTARSPGAIVFYHADEWGDKAGEYLSDYHGTNKQSDSWLFLVNSTRAGALVTLQWDGLFELAPYQQNGQTRYHETRDSASPTLQKLQLLDVETGTITPAVDGEGNLQKYSFVMDDSGSRQFRWILGPVNASYFAPSSKAMQHIKARQQALDKAEKARQKAEETAGRSLPPG